MRVTFNTFPNSLVTQLGDLASRQIRLQNQAATGQRIEFPEDDPAAVRRVLDLQTESKALDQYKRNIANLQDQANASYDVIKGLKTISDQAGEIATLADGTKSPEELKIYATQVNEMIRYAVQLSNSRNRGDYLLGGTRSDQVPFVATENAAGQVTAVSYQGNTSLAESEIAQGTTLTALTLGANTSNAGPLGLISDNRVGADFFNHLISLQNNLLAGNTDAISNSDRPALGRDEENIISHVANSGSVMARLETSATLATNRNASLQTLVSKEADADLAETLVRLTSTQTAYQAALQSGAKILNLSLMDYLR